MVTEHWMTGLKVFRNVRSASLWAFAVVPLSLISSTSSAGPYAVERGAHRVLAWDLSGV